MWSLHIEALHHAGSASISKDAVLEIKCPTQKKAIVNYIKDGQITGRYLAQVQMQMHVTGRKQCYFCVADPEYEVDKDVQILFSRL